MYGGYEHYVKASEKKVVFSKTTTVLVDEKKSALFIDYIKRLDKIDTVAIQLALSGKDVNKDKICGFAMSVDGASGYYIPIEHDRDSNSLHEQGIELLEIIFKKANKILFYGAVKSLRFLQEAKIDVKIIQYIDVELCVFLSDTNRKNPDFNFATEHFLGDTVSDEAIADYNLRYVRSENCYEVICKKSAGLFLLYQKTKEYLQEAGFAGKIENDFLYTLMECENSKVFLDSDYIKKIYKKESEDVENLIKDIYRLAGGEFNLNAPAMVLHVLKNNGINVEKTDEKTLRYYLKNNTSKLVERIIEYGSLSTFLNAYVKPLALESGKSFTRLHYKPFSAATCRLAGSADGKSNYFAKFNIQSFVKPQKKEWYVHEYKGEDIRENEIVIDKWRFSQLEESDKVIMGFSQNHNLRNALVAPDGFLIVSSDYDTEELRILANYSNESEWIEAFRNDEDLHKKKAEFFWGKENYTEQKRDAVKALNYGITYGLKAWTIARDLGISEKEAEDLYCRFILSIPRIRQFQQETLQAALKDGTVYNYFGLPRRVKWWLNNKDKKVKEAGTRIVSNTVVQSVGATVLKIAMMKLQKSLYENEAFSDDVFFMNTIHDEINSYVRKEKVNSVVKKIQSCMELKVPSWEIPFKIGIKIGDRWGRLFPFEINENGIIPSFK